MSIISIILLVLAGIGLALIFFGVAISQRALNILFLALVVLLVLNSEGVL